MDSYTKKLNVIIIRSYILAGDWRWWLNENKFWLKNKLNFAQKINTLLSYKKITTTQVAKFEHNRHLIDVNVGGNIYP